MKSFYSHSMQRSNNNNKPKTIKNPGLAPKKTTEFKKKKKKQQQQRGGVERRVTAPAAIGTTRSSHPQVTSITVRKRERLTALVSPVGGTGVILTNYINAGNIASSTSSFLARQAQLFDKYRFRKLTFHYVPVVSTAVAGNLMLGADVSCTDAVPTDSPGFTNLSLGFSEGNVWTRQSFDVKVAECFEKNLTKFVRSGTTQLGSQASLYDTCAFHAYVEGAPDSTTLGYLDVEYDVELVGVNRNSAEGLSSQVQWSGACSLVFAAGSSQTPGGTYAGSTFATFTGLNETTVGTKTYNGGWTVQNRYGTLPAGLTQSSTGVTLPAGVYRIRGAVTVLSDTFVNGLVRFSFPGGSASGGFGWGTSAASAPVTAYAQAATVPLDTGFFTVTAATALCVISVTMNYSATVTAGKTFFVVNADPSGTSMSNFQIEYYQNV